MQDYDMLHRRFIPNKKVCSQQDTGVGLVVPSWAGTRARKLMCMRQIAAWASWCPAIDCACGVSMSLFSRQSTDYVRFRNDLTL